MEYNFQEIEKKWQEKWEKSDLYKAEDFSDKPKKYILVEFPYPSGAGLHVGHVRSYTALDIVSRKARMQGYNVLYPIGWDAFGLPTENYAIKNKIHPRQATEENIATFKRQLKSLGLSFDWSREIDTTDPEYYKWTQWIFLKFFEKGLAYKKKMPINWCTSCKIGLANEEVLDGKCERCGSMTEKKEKKQWLLAITKYADRLIEDLKTVDYLEKIRAQQINWIGRSEGAEFELRIKNYELSIKIFTTRLDTVFGVTYAVVAPEHEIIKNIELGIKNYREVKEYILQAKNKSEMERTELLKDKTGIELKGIKAVNPFNNQEIPVFVADYVLGHYGTGAVMAVPAHDERDWEFARKYNLPIKQVICKNYPKPICPILEQALREEDGFLVDSGEYTGLTSAKAREKMMKWLEKNNLGGKKINYKLRDWIFSRQHYWGEPIPIIICNKCGYVPVPENALPVKLPDVENYEPTDTGESPLAAMADWVNIKCPKCGGEAKRETDTMPNWAGSSWYFLRYIDPKNEKVFADYKKLEYWLAPARHSFSRGGVDLYNGGMEHTTLHLLYSRFWHKFLYDLKLVPTAEPYAKRRSQGMVLAEDGKKMSKSLGNVINPDEVVEKYGADALRLYEMFMGPFDQAIPWSTEGVKGVQKFLKRVFDYLRTDGLGVFKDENDFNEWNNGNIERYKFTSPEIKKLLNKTIKKISDDINNFKFNTAVSQLMIFLNSFYRFESKIFTDLSTSGNLINKSDFEKFIIILSPLAPHLAEELWEKLGHTESIFKQKWPEYDKDLIKDEVVSIVIQINGKLRDTVEVSAGASQEEVKKIILKREKIKTWLAGKEIKKTIFVLDKLINLVV